MSIKPPKEALYEWHTVKPSSFAVFLLMCEAKDSRSTDVYLELPKAQKAGIKKSAYYQAFAELENKEWIEFSRTSDGKKWWKLTKGNSANVENEGETDSANVEKSINVETLPEEIPQTWKENSTNVESPLEPPIRNNLTKEEIKPKEEGNTPRTEKTRIPFNFTLTEEMHEWAKLNVPEIDVHAATEDFYEYWSNLEGKKALKTDWFLTWKKGMRLQAKWQKEKSNAISKDNNGNGHKPTKQTNADIWHSYGYYDNN